MDDNKTLADVQPGGVVRLGDGVKECARRNCKERTGSANADCTGCGGTGYRRECNDPDCAEHGCCGYGKCYVNPTEKALSAQPSPAGQDAAIEAMADSLYCAQTSATMEQAREQARLLLVDALPHLAARQPVGEAVAVVTTNERFTYGKLNGDLPDGTMLYAASQPVGELLGYLIDSDNPEIGRYFHEYPVKGVKCRPIYEGIGDVYAAPPPPAQAVDTWAVIDRVAKNWDGCSIGPSIRAEAEKVIGQPAQAVDLGQFRKAVEAWKRDAESRHHSGDIFPEQEDAIWREADRLLALIDSQA